MTLWSHDEIEFSTQSTSTHSTRLDIDISGSYACMQDAMQTMGGDGKMKLTRLFVDNVEECML